MSKDDTPSTEDCNPKPGKQRGAQEQDSIERQVNKIVIQQRITDGFVNGTAMCSSRGKDIRDWLKSESTIRLVTALAERLKIKSSAAKIGTSVYKGVSATYPTLVVTKYGSPKNGGGTWVHPKLAVHVGQWCDEVFALQVSDWIEEWMTIVYNNEAERNKQNQQTQYQRRIIAACVDGNASPWQKRFDNISRDEACRVTGQSPRTAWLICRYLYEQMPIGVYEEIKRVNPRVDGRRKNKQHQHLKGAGLSVLEKLQDTFITIMRLSPDNNLKRFRVNLEKAFSTTLQLDAKYSVW